MELNPKHPLTLALCALSPVVGANYVLRSARDSEHEPDKFPLVEYVVHKERKSEFDFTRKCWRVELVVQLDFLLEEDNALECLAENELSDSQAIQALQFGLTSRIRSLIQFLILPSSIGEGYKDEDFIWSDYGFKLVELVESVYFRKKGSDELTGASSLFVLSVLDKDNIICCTEENQDEVLCLLKPESVSARLLKKKIEEDGQN